MRWMAAARLVSYTSLFHKTFMIICYDYRIENWDGSWMVWGRTISGSRPCGRLQCEEGVWVVITAIVWIARPCVAYVAKLNYEVFECVHVHSYPFYVTKFDYLHNGEFWKRRISCFKMIVAIIISVWWRISTKWIQFWEWTWLNGGIPKEFYKGVSCMKQDFTVRGSKLVSRYDQFKWLR